MKRSFDVVYQGIYCLTITAPSEQEALLMAFHALGLDEGAPHVEVFEVAA